MQNLSNAKKNVIAFLIGLAVAFAMLIFADRFYFLNPSVITPKDMSYIRKLELPLQAFDFNVLQEQFIKDKIKYTGLKGSHLQLPVKPEKIETDDGYNFRVVTKSNLDETVTDITYFEDRLHRRITPGNDSKRQDTTVIFLGCSYMYGEGLEADETIPALFGKQFKNIRALNGGIFGSSLNELLFLIEDHPELLDFPTKKVVLVYGIIPSHLMRENCNSRCYYSGPENDSLLKKPRYELQDHKAVFKGQHKDFYNNPFLKFTIPLFKSLTSGPFAFPDIYSLQSAELHGVLLAEIKKNFAKKFEVIDAYQVPLISTPGERLADFVTKDRVSDFKNVFIPFQQVRDAISSTGIFFNIPLVGNPTKTANLIVAQALRFQLMKDHPEIFGNLPKGY